MQFVQVVMKLLLRLITYIFLPLLLSARILLHNMGGALYEVLYGPEIFYETVTH